MDGNGLKWICWLLLGIKAVRSPWISSMGYHFTVPRCLTAPSNDFHEVTWL